MKICGVTAKTTLLDFPDHVSLPPYFRRLQLPLPFLPQQRLLGNDAEEETMTELLSSPF